MPKSVRAAAINDFDVLVSELGGNPAKIYQQISITRSQLKDPETLIPADLVGQILNLSAQETQCEHFGLELAKRRDIRNYLGMLGDICYAASTLGDGLRQTSSLFNVHSEANLWQLHQTDKLVYIVFTLLDESPEHYRLLQQLAIALLWRFMNVLTERRWHPTMISYTFSKPSNLLPYQRFFGLPIIFDADSSGILFHTADLGLELSDRDANLHQKLLQHAQVITDAKISSIDEEVRIQIRKDLELERVSVDDVTDLFPFEQRTLQRRLRATGTSYQKLFDDTRITMAMELLANSDISITHLSDRLCFRYPANYSRAFKRYTGCTPREWRQHARIELLGRR